MSIVIPNSINSNKIKVESGKKIKDSSPEKFSFFGAYSEQSSNFKKDILIETRGYIDNLFLLISNPVLKNNLKDKLYNIINKIQEIENSNYEKDIDIEQLLNIIRLNNLIDHKEKNNIHKNEDI